MQPSVMMEFYTTLHVSRRPLSVLSLRGLRGLSIAAKTYLPLDRFICRIRTSRIAGVMGQYTGARLAAAKDTVLEDPPFRAPPKEATLDCS